MGSPLIPPSSPPLAPHTLFILLLLLPLRHDGTPLMAVRANKCQLTGILMKPQDFLCSCPRMLTVLKNMKVFGFDRQLVTNIFTSPNIKREVLSR